MSAGKWGICAGDDGLFSGDFDTKEKAIAAAAAEYDLGPGDRFQVGRYVQYDPPQIWACDVLDNVTCNSEDLVGEAAEDWLSNVPKEDEEKLTERLTKVFHDWLKEFGHEPEFLMVQDTEECTVPGATSQTK